jgi:hypothetical protein
MIRTLDDLPDGVIGFEADGEFKHFPLNERDAAVA